MAASSAMAGIGGVATALAGAPWWITALLLIVVVVQTIFPQESGDRLEWWRDRRRHQRLTAGKNAASKKPPVSPVRRLNPPGGVFSLTSPQDAGRHRQPQPPEAVTTHAVLTAIVI
jgi:hypothetical protein